MADVPSALVFLGSHNEVDQISPVIYKLATRETLSIDVVLQTGVPRDDYRIEAIDCYDCVSVYSRGGERDLGDRLRSAALNSAKAFGRKLPTDVPERIYRRFQGATSDDAGPNLLIPEALSGTKYDVVGFDWTHASGGNRFSDRDDVTTIVLPHGDSPYTNFQLQIPSHFEEFLDELRDNQGVMEGEKIPVYNNYRDFLKYDRVVFPNELTASRLVTDDRTDQLRVLGSPRYNPEWLDVLSEIAPPAEITCTEGLQVVLFVRQAWYFVSEREVTHTIELLDAVPGVEAVVKEHPRDPLLDSSAADDLEDVHVVRDDVESASLVAWGDVFLDLGTTISFEPIVRGKPVLELDYAHANYAVISHYFSNVDMRCKDDLFYAIRDFLVDGVDDFYDSDERNQFVNEMVSTGNATVLDSYADLFEEAAGV